MADSVQLGPFELAERIDSGGMGDIYRGSHRATGVPAAVKVIRRTANDAARRRFHEEVRAHAALHHPSVVYLFEYGTIGSDAARASNGKLHAGDPFVAMEFADRGTVRDAMPITSWTELRQLLGQTLDGLAYAHARGVVHRDLKPENLLVFDSDAEPPNDWRIKLADFGIAHAFEGERDVDTEKLESAAGTPQYMAPEQFRGEWRRYGPWTDLYALGCIAWELVCGRAAFTGENAFEIAVSHETDPRPPLDPQFPVPDELERWIHRAMDPEPERRFRRAADAAWALSDDLRARPTRESDKFAERETREFSDARRTTETRPSTDPMHLGPTLPVPALVETAPAADLPDEEEAGGSNASLEAAAGLLADHRAPVPEDWQPKQLESLPAPPIGAGLGLFGLREPPFVNRESECDRIWEALHEVVERRTFRAVFLTGEAGTGKSRLVEHIATRAHEIGAVEVVRAVHTSGGGRKEGLRGALESALRCVKMERGELYGHLLETLPSDESAHDPWLERDARALTEYLRPTDDDMHEVDGPAYRFSTPGQKYALVARILERLAARRPVLLWLDDLQWGPEAIGLLEYVDERPDEAPPALILATARSDVLAEQPRTRERIESLRSREWSRTLQLDPLSREHQRQLLVDLLPLEDDLADDLARRTEGHPLFAMQLLGDWIEEEALEAGPDGFRVPQGRELDLPEDIHALWLRRIDRLVDDLDVGSRESARHAIERTAVLGRDVDRDEWRAVCDQLGIDRPDRVRDGLVERGLAESTETGWAFAHGLLVGSLERQSRDADRWRTHNRKCAELLEQLDSVQPNATAARRADHWVEAGELEEALNPLEIEWTRLLKSGRYRAARATGRRRRKLLDALDVSEDDHRRIETDLMIVTAERILGSSADTTLPLAEDARDRAEAIGGERLLAIAWREIATLRRDLGELHSARQAAERATQHARRSGDVFELCGALTRAGWMHFLEGNLEEAESYFSRGYEHAVGAANRFRRLQAKSNSAWLATSRGDEELAERLFEESLEESREAGFRGLEMRCLNGLGDLARFQGNAEEARQRYRRYARLGREVDHRKHLANAHLNLAQVELLAGRFDEARQKLEETQRRSRAIPFEDAYAHVFRLTRMVLAAGSGEWSQVDAHLSPYAAGWPEETQVEADHPWLLELAGDYAAEAGEHDRAERIWKLARDLWDHLDNPRARDRLAGKLDD